MKLKFPLPRLLLTAAGCSLLGCVDPLLEPTSGSSGAHVTDTADTESFPTTWPQSTACALDPLDPSALLITTTDFSTGAVSVLDLASGEVQTDVELGTPDGIPYGFGGRAAIVHRFQYDYVDLLRPDGGWRSTGQHALTAPDAEAPNPHGIAFDDDGLAYVTLYGSRELLVLDPTRPPASSTLDRIDLSGFSDSDGRPETNLIVRCGDTLWVSIERLDVPGGYARVDTDQLVAIDLASRTPFDLDPSTPGPQGLSLQGAWLKQLRRDPTDPSGTVLLGLTTGIERIDLQTGEVEWLVPPSAFETVGIENHLLPLAFDVSADGSRAYLAAYGPAPGDDVDCAVDVGACFEQARLFEIDLQGAGVPVPFHEGFQAVERTLELVDSTLWVGSRHTEGPGMYAFDTRTSPPTLTAGPLSTGLPPYSITTFEAL